MRAWMMGLTVGALALTAGCNNPEQHTVRDPESGAEVTMQSGENMRAPSNLPAYAPIYPGARIQNVMEASNAGSDGAGEGGMVVFHTDADVATVEAFYRQRLDASPLTERSETRINGSLILGATSPDDSGTSVQLTISPSDDPSGSNVSMVYSAAS